MKFIEEHIRKLLGRETPPPLDADDLWAGIVAGLPEEGDRPTSGILTIRRNLAFLGGILLLLAGITAAVWLNQPTKEYSVTLATDAPGTSPLPTIKPAQNTITTNDSELTIQDELAPSRKNEDDDSALARDTGTKKSSTATPSLMAAADNSSGQPANRPPFSSTASSGAQKTDLPQTSPPHLTPAEQPRGLNPLGSDLPTPNTTTEVITSRAAPSAISLLPVPAFAPARSTNSVTTTTPRSLPDVNIVAPSFKSAAGPRSSLGLHAGGNLQIERFSGNEAPTVNSLNQASGQAVGQSLALDFHFRLNNRFGLGLGVEYHRTINTFRHVIERDTMVAHPTPPNTGLIDAIVRHSVTHNNRRELISVPLLLVYQRRLGDFTLSLGAGLSANYQLSATGRTLDAGGQFTRYTAPATSQFFLACQIQPAVTWQLRPDSPWQLQLRTDVRYFNMGNNSLNSLGQKGWLIGGTIGVRRRL